MKEGGLITTEIEERMEKEEGMERMEEDVRKRKGRKRPLPSGKSVCRYQNVKSAVGCDLTAADISRKSGK